MALRRAGRGYVLGVNATHYFDSWHGKPAFAGTAEEIAKDLGSAAWANEVSFKTAKNELGLTHNETRSWYGWHRHMSLVMLAFAMITVIRHHVNKPTLQKTSAVRRTRRPRPLVNPGDPPHSHLPGTAAYPTCPNHSLVNLATRSSSRRANGTPQTKSAAVMLGCPFRLRPRPPTLHSVSLPSSECACARSRNTRAFSIASR